MIDGGLSYYSFRDEKSNEAVAIVIMESHNLVFDLANRYLCRKITNSSMQVADRIQYDFSFRRFDNVFGYEFMELSAVYDPADAEMAYQLANRYPLTLSKLTHNDADILLTIGNIPYFSMVSVTASHPDDHSYLREPDNVIKMLVWYCG